MKRYLATLLCALFLTAPALARGLPLWSAKRCFNTLSLAFITPLNGTAFGATMTTANLQYLRARGVDCLRIGFNPAGLLGAANQAAEDVEIGHVTTAVAAALAQDLKVIVDAHYDTDASRSPGWDVATIQADYPAGAKWTRMKAMTVRMCEALKNHDIRRVAFQQFNEFVGTQTSFNAKVLDIYTSCRTVNQAITIIIGGDGYSDTDGLAGWTLSGFTGPYVVAATPYKPQQYTHANKTGTLFQYGATDILWPPDASQRTALKDGIDASSLSAPDKVTAKGYIDDYMDTPNDMVWIKGRLDIVNAFLAANNLPRQRFFVTEFGEGSLNDNASRVRWLTFMRLMFEANGWGWSYWNYDDSGSTDGFNLGFPTIVADKLAALGLTANPTAPTGAALIFNVNTNSMYVPLL